MKSKIYSSEFMRASSKGQLWISGFLALGFLMAFPVFELLMMGSWFGMEYESAQIEMLYENLWKNGFLFTGFIVIILGGITNGINGFWYLFSSKKVDFYHSLPITRKKLFWQKTYLGFWYYFIPYLIFWFMAICIGAMRGFFSLKLMGLAVKMMCIHFILYFMLYFVTVLVISVTGNILMGFLTLAGTFLYGPTLGILLWMYIRFFFETGYGKEYGLQKFLIDYGSPLTFGMTFLKAYASQKRAYLFLLLLAVTLLLGGLAYFAFIKRKAESAGKPMAYYWLGVIIKFLIVVPSGLGCGLIFYMMPMEQNKMPWWIFGMLLGTVLIHGVIEIIYKLDFKAFFSARIQLVLAGCLVALLAVTYQFDLLHYDTYLPSREKLKAINVDCDAIYGGNEYFSYIEKTENGKYKIIKWNERKSAITKKTESFDKEIHTVLSEIVQKQNKSKDWDVELPIKYTLDSGKSVYRRYKVTEKELKKFLSACYKEGELQRQKYSFLSIDSKYLEWLSCTFYDGSSYTLFQNNTEQYNQLLEALRQDIQECTAEGMLGIPCMKLYLQYENLPMEGSTDSSGVNSTSYYYTTVNIYPTFKHTIDILKQTGYPVAAEEVVYSSIEMNYYPQDNEDAYSIEYTDPKEIEKIKEVMIPSDFLTNWIEEDKAIMLICYKDKEQESYAYLPEADIPQFIKEDIENYEKNSSS